MIIRWLSKFTLLSISISSKIPERWTGTFSYNPISPPRHDTYSHLRTLFYSNNGSSRSRYLTSLPHMMGTITASEVLRGWGKGSLGVVGHKCRNTPGEGTTYPRRGLPGWSILSRYDLLKGLVFLFPRRWGETTRPSEWESWDLTTYSSERWGSGTTIFLVYSSGIPVRAVMYFPFYGMVRDRHVQR